MSDNNTPQDQGKVAPPTTIPTIIAFGNVLLDFSVKINDTEILDRYNLILDTQGEISSQKLLQITQEIQKKFEITFNAGGSALNTCRILKSINGPRTLFFGAIGNDENGDILKRIFKDNNIETCLQTIDNYPTGQCICFIYNDKTGLYANIGASIKFNKDYLQSCEKIFINNQLKIIQQIFYIEGFFITQRYDVCEFIIKNYIINNSKLSLLAFNLNSSYIIKENIEIIKFIINYSTLIFGNAKEFQTLADMLNLKTIDDLAKMFLLDNSKQQQQQQQKQEKILIITNGSKDILVYTNYQQYENFNIKNEWKYIFNVPKIPNENIVDTTGAGDAFVAGFLNAFVNKSTINYCIEEGCRIANLVIKNVGCKIE